MKKYFLICLAIFIMLLLVMIKIAFSADIVVGSAAIDRSSSSGYNTTCIATENPANASGVIDHIEIYMSTIVGGIIDVAAFEQVGANIFTSRGSSGNLTAAVGLNTFDAPGDFTAFDINAGDYIGVYIMSSESIDRANTGSGYWTNGGDEIPCTDLTFTFTASRTISLYAEGSTGEAPPEVGVQPIILLLE